VIAHDYLQRRPSRQENSYPQRGGAHQQHPVYHRFFASPQRSHQQRKGNFDQHEGGAASLSYANTSELVDAQGNHGLSGAYHHQHPVDRFFHDSRYQNDNYVGKAARTTGVKLSDLLLY